MLFKRSNVRMGLAMAALLFVLPAGALAQGSFPVEEASISSVHAAIKAGRTTCKQVVEAYLDRAKAYNGVCTALLTKDGASIPAKTGVVRAGAPIKFPTQTVAAAKVLPDLPEYAGLPIEFGRMEASISDPTVQIQSGMRVGIADAGQVNALETINIRGERSVTCKGEFDRHPAQGPLPANAPAFCEEFRKQPDALERAAELDKQYGRNPDLATLPMYCVVFSLKNWYDAKDIRGTGGNDVAYAMDVPKYDSPDIAELRRKGAIIYAVAAANESGIVTARGPNKPKSYFPENNLQYGQWGGQACNPYDTTRVPRGTSAGSGVSVAANLAMCSICEQGFASCKGPASRNNIVNLLTTKGVLMDGGISSKGPGDRAGIHCKSVNDAALVLDAIKGYESDDMYTSLPKGIIPREPYASSVVKDAAVASKPLKGTRVGVVREFMVKHTKNDEAISDLLDKEIKTVMRDKLGAELLESVDPMYSDDPALPNLKYTFRDAFAEILPQTAPEFFYQAESDGTLTYAVPGWDVKSVDYMTALALGKAPLSDKVNLRSIVVNLGTPSSSFFMNKYLAVRGDTRVKDWASFVANTKFETDAQRAGAENAILDNDPREPSASLSYMKMHSVLRLVVLKVMHENKIDVFVNPEQTTAPYLLGYAGEPEVNNRPTLSCCGRFTALMGAPEVEVPAGYVSVTYDPQYVLSADKKTYEWVTGTVQSKLPKPMPMSLMFWAGPGFDPDVIKAASAYEAATHHRVPPADFGPVKAPRATR